MPDDAQKLPTRKLPAPNQFALLKTRRLLPVFLVQFPGTFNDQVYQKAFVAPGTYRLAEQVGMDVVLLGAIASALVVAALLWFGLQATEIPVLVTLGGLPMSIVVARCAPATVLAKVALTLWPRGSR